MKEPQRYPPVKETLDTCFPDANLAPYQFRNEQAAADRCGRLMLPSPSHLRGGDLLESFDAVDRR